MLASPGCHQAYLAVRHELLKCLVKRQYTGLFDLTEALTAVRSEGLYFSFQMENAISLLDDWRRRSEIHELSQSSPNHLDESNSLEEITKLLHFHKMLLYFLEDYSINAPKPPWIQPMQWENEYLPLQLSFSEKIRFIRAICRLQIVKNIFGDPVRCVKRSSCDSCGRWKYWKLGETDELKKLERENGVWYVSEMAYRLFYGAIPPWEHEEMGGVLRYLVAKVYYIYKEIAHDLRELSKNTPCEFFRDILPEEQRPPPGSEVEIEHDLVHFPQQFEGLAGLGPEFLYRALHMDRLSRRNILCINKRGFWEGPFIGLKIGLSWDHKFPFTDPADRHEPSNFEHFWSTLPPLEQPTSGWKKAWLLPHNREDILEDSMDLDKEPEEDWEWGYALWDEKRLKEWKASLLEKHGSQ